MVIVAFILAIVIYLGGGVIATDIYYSINPIDDYTTLGEIFQTRIIIYNTICCIGTLICAMFADEKYTTRIIWFGFGVPFVCYLLIKFLPISTGIDLANAIACVITLGISIHLALKNR